MSSRSKSKFLIELLEVIIIVFALSWFSKTFIFGFAQMPDDSMLPTLGVNNHILVDKCFYKNTRTLKRGDIVVFLTDNNQNENIKRLIGLAGDKIEIRNGFTYVNDKPLYEPYAHIPITNQFKPIIVPDDHIFVLNDNRTAKDDSRLTGSIPKENLVGKAVLCYWPWPRIKSL